MSSELSRYEMICSKIEAILLGCEFYVAGKFGESRRRIDGLGECLSMGMSGLWNLQLIHSFAMTYFHAGAPDVEAPEHAIHSPGSRTIGESKIGGYRSRVDHHEEKCPEIHAESNIIGYHAT